jgi:hypothetical protein
VGAAPVAPPESGDGGCGGSGSGGSSYDSYYDMQRNGPYIADTNIRQDELIRNVESWNENRVDLDDVDDDAVLRRSADYHTMGDLCDGAVDHVGLGGGDQGSVGNSTLSSITHEAWFPRFDLRGKFTSYHARHGANRSITTRTASSPTQASSQDKSVTSPPPSSLSSRSGHPSAKDVRSPATGGGGGALRRRRLVLRAEGATALAPPPHHGLDSRRLA